MVVDAAGMETGYFIRCLSSSRQRTDGFYGASHHTVELLSLLRVVIPTTGNQSSRSRNSILIGELQSRSSSLLS